MKLDSRILEGKKPLDCFDAENKELIKPFLNKEGYFSNNLENFCLLDGCFKRLLSNVFKEVKDCFKTSINGGDGGSWKYFLPAEWVLPEEPEKKYRALTLNEFLERFKIGKAIYIRSKKDGAERVVVFAEYSIPPHKDEGNDTESVCLTGIEHHNSVVCIGMREYYLTTLFDCYEYFDGKEWQPFGVEVKEEGE